MKKTHSKTVFALLVLLLLPAVGQFAFVEEGQAQSGNATLEVMVCQNVSNGTLITGSGADCPNGYKKQFVPFRDTDLCILKANGSWEVRPVEVETNGTTSCKKYEEIQGYTDIKKVSNPARTTTATPTPSPTPSTPGTPSTSPTTNPTNQPSSGTGTSGIPSSTTSSGVQGSCPPNFEAKGPICVPRNPFGNSRGIAGQGTIAGVALIIIQFLLTMAGIVAVIFLIIGGYYWMTARGNDTQATNGRKTVTNALIGLAIVVLSYVIVQALTNFIIKGS